MRSANVWWVALVAVATVSACGKAAPEAAGGGAAVAVAEAAKPGEIAPDRLKAFGALPAVMAADPATLTDELVSLGRMLYFDTRLSKNHDVSCNSCHGLQTYGVDGQATSEGHKKQRGGRNSPTVYNAAGHFAQFWDGRAADVEAQALGPMTNPVEMAMASGEQVTAVLRSIPGYADLFAKAFPGVSEPVTYENAGKAIAAFERKLVTPSRWDAFLGGKADALTAAEKDGFNAFIDAGCMACHTGTYVGGSMYQKLGLVKPWPGLEDTGRMEVTKNEADKHFFKVPSLRNIARTGPYFHDGKVADLNEAVTLMARHQLAKELSKEQVASIVTWLNALTGELPPAELITAPELPPSGPETPAPDPG
ncbi:MAG: cytochrome c peroxidase [Myxococcota bacterium]